MEPRYAVYCGVDVGKGEHHAVGLKVAGQRLFDKALPNDEAKLRAMFDRLATHGPLLIVVDQPNTIGALPVAVARACGHDISYLPGLAMLRIADLYPGQAKTDARDAFIIAALPQQTVVVPGAKAAEIVLPKLADSLKAAVQQRQSLAADIERMLDDQPLSRVLTSMPGVGGQDRRQDFARGRRRLDVQDLRAPRRLRRDRARDPSLRLLDPGRVPGPLGQSQTQTSAVPVRIRSAARPGQPRLLRPQTCRRQEAQRRPHLPRRQPSCRGTGLFRPALSAFRRTTKREAV